MGSEEFREVTSSARSARYLRAVVSADPEAVTVSVPGPTVHVQLSKGRPSVRVRLSSEVRAFVQAFDAGLFPDLVEHPLPLTYQKDTLEPSA